MRILIADDHALLRKGLIQVLVEEYPQAQFGEAGTTSETLQSLAMQHWDVLVLDIFMPGGSGLDVLQECARSYSRLPVLVLSSAPEEQLARRVLKAGASGYLNKQAAPEELVSAVKRVAAGRRYVSAALAERLLEEAVSPGSATKVDALSAREFAVLQGIMEGRSIKQIADELSISAKTVSTFHTRIWEKFGVRSDVEMIRHAIRLGLVNETLEQQSEGKP
jgi:DNA-binding NarL/FixJ family response regulator